MFTRRARVLAALGVVASTLAGCGGVSTTAPGSSRSLPSPGEQATVICHSSSPLFALVAVTPSGSHTAELLATKDFEHFQNVTPSGLALPAKGDQLLDGSCPTASDFWVVSASPGGGSGWLLQTTDGGAEWQVNRQLWTGSAGGGSVVFADVDHGMVVAGAAGANSSTSVETADGGEKWSSVSLPFDLLVNFQLQAPSFANPTTAFTAVSSLPPEPGSEIQSTVMESSDAGATWTRSSPPVHTAGELLYTQPHFFGSRGILPVLVVKPSLRLGAPSAAGQQGSANVIIDATSNAGRSWKSLAPVSLAAPVQLGIPGTRGLDTLQGSPSVAVGNPSTIWIAYARQDGRVTITATQNGGRSWLSVPTNGLPSVPRASDLQSGVSQPVSIQAVNGRVAFVSLATNPSGPPVTYLTVDGGIHWTGVPHA